MPLKVQQMHVNAHGLILQVLINSSATFQVQKEMIKYRGYLCRQVVFRFT